MQKHYSSWCWLEDFTNVLHIMSSPLTETMMRALWLKVYVIVVSPHLKLTSLFDPHLPLCPSVLISQVLLKQGTATFVPSACRNIL